MVTPVACPCWLNRMAARMVLEPKPGTYALILSCSTDFGIQIGRLGTMRLQPGYYLYLGSALGLGACVPGSPTIRSHPSDPTGTSTTCERTPRFIVFGLATMRGDVSTNGPVWCRRCVARRSLSAGSEPQTAIVGRIFISSSVAHHGSASSEAWNSWSSDTLRWRSSSLANGLGPISPKLRKRELGRDVTVFPNPPWEPDPSTIWANRVLWE